ncbi:hypothetical protein PVAP13_8KG146403 [Panicum virgatum]|uniref:Uncharacterized protein n=1 Tax=Panicum virgatum TaxID=38727 RepID=A0A8T0PN51_PANVG|nr:hypothetical protein PVAP13_8KG146403 [Panicum virgatum]
MEQGMGQSRRRGGEEGGAAAAPSPQRCCSVRPSSSARATEGCARLHPPMELRGAAPGPRSYAATGPAGARHSGLLHPPLRRLPPELRRWPSAPHPPPCAGAGRRPSPSPSAASADGGARREGEGVICIYAMLSQHAQSTLDPMWGST